MISRAFCLLATVLILWGCVTTTKAHNPLERAKYLDLSCNDCNVIFLDIDLLRADFVGLMNERRHTTPNIDAFFEKAIIFEDVSASSGVTAISNTATLMARDGEFTHALLRKTYVDNPPQMPHRYQRLFSKLPTIAEILHLKGYETININHSWYAGKQMLLDRGIDRYWGSGEVGENDNAPGIVIAKTTEIINEKIIAKNKFFLLMRSEDLRGLPYRYPSNRPQVTDSRIQYKKMGNDQYNIYFQPMPDGTLTAEWPSHARVNWMPDTDIEVYRKLSQTLYTQQLTFVDEELGKLFSVIEDSYLLDNTIVVLYSNHGDGLYDNRVPNHGVSYQSCISVPMIIRHPKIKKATRIPEAVALIDLVPTIYKMVSARPPDDVDGVSLLDVINGGRYPRSYFFGSDKESKYVRQGKMKLLVWADRTKELFNLAVDSGESNNIAKEYPHLVTILYERMIAHEIEQLDRALQVLTKDSSEDGK